MRAVLVLAGIVAVASCARSPATPVAGSERHATIMFFSDAHADLEAHPEQFPRADGTIEVASAGGYARGDQGADQKEQTERK